MASDPAFSFWLIPAEPLRSRLRSIIDHLAAKHASAAFDPHVTVFSAPGTENKARAVASAIASAYGPVRLTPAGLEHSALFTKTFYVQFEASTELRRIHDAIKAHFPSASYTFNPHLSLLYKKMDEAVQMRLCRELEAPRENYLFTHLRVIRHEAPFTHPDQVKDWRAICDCALAA